MPRVQWNADMGPEWDLPRFWRQVRRLRKDFPVGCRVVVKLIENGDIRSDDGSSCHGITITHPKSFEIQIYRNTDISVCIRFLIEEWCHCLAPGKRKSHHNQYRDIHHKVLYHYLGD